MNLHVEIQVITIRNTSYRIGGPHFMFEFPISLVTGTWAYKNLNTIISILPKTTFLCS